MRPIYTPHSNFTYVLPGVEFSVPALPYPSHNLPCRREDGIVYSTWELTAEERIAVAEGANIELAVWHEPIPPVSLSIDSTPRVIEERP